MVNVNAGGDQRLHPQVEGMTIDIDIASLVVTRERCGDVDGFDAENLRISDHIDRKRQPIANKRSLRVRCQQTATRFAETFSTMLVLFIQRDHLHFAC